MKVDATDWTGQKLCQGRYFVKCKLGEGGMASVYLADDNTLGSQVVIKVPRAEVLQEMDFAARFTREVRSLVRLVHPHILKVFDAGEHNDLPFAVSQYL